MSASHRPTDIHRRQHRLAKRNKLRARIAAAPATGRAAFEARLQRTYSPFHTMMTEKLPPTAV
jgi:hypothetical protein